MDIKKLFGNRVRDLRLKNDMSQEELAYFLNIQPSTLSCLENGKSFASASTLEKLCEVLRMHPNELFSFDYKKPEAEAQKIIDSINFYLTKLDKEKLRYVEKIVKTFVED